MRQSSNKSMFESLEQRALLSALPFGGIVNGSIAQSGQVDTYTFDANAGDTIELAMTATTAPGFKPVAELFSPSGRRVNWTYAGSQRRWQLPTSDSGTYTVRVSDQDGLHTGGYALGLEGIAPISPNPARLPIGGIARGTISTALDVDQFTFQGNAGDVIELAMSASAGPGFKPVAELFSPSGRRLNWTYAGAQRRWQLPSTESGQYMVQVMDQDALHTGSYAIGLETLVPHSPDALALGATASNSIGTPLEVDQFNLYAQAGDQIRFNFSTRTVDAGATPLIEVFQPSGARIRWNRPGVFNVTAREQGQYLVQVMDQDLIRRFSYTISTTWLTPTAGSIEGSAFADADRDKRRTAGEAGLANVSVFLDTNGNGILDDGERSVLTDVVGNYAFTALRPGTYRVCEVVPAGWARTTASRFTVSVAGGRAITGQNFGNIR